MQGGERGDEAYDAFISYSHTGDRPLAIAVQAGLQRFAKPWYRRRALRVFRDESSLSATPGLWPTIQQTLAASNYFVLIASPESRDSHWVSQEVRYWLGQGRRDRLLLVLSAGHLTWAQHDFDWTRTDALSPVLQDVFDQEPLHVDLRWARSQAAVSRRDARLTEPLASLAAPMHGRPRDELIGEDLRQHRRTLTIARSAVITLVALLVAAVTLGVQANIQRNRAEHEARIAMARLLATESTSVGPDGVDVGLLLAAQAYVAEPDAPSSWGALASALTRSSALVGYLPDSAAVTTVMAAPDGDLLAVGDERGAVTLWHAVRREQVRVLASSLSSTVTVLAFSNDGDRLIAGDDTGGYAVWKIASGRSVSSGTVPAAVMAVGLDPSGVSFAIGTEGYAVLVGRIGEAPRQLPGTAFALDLVFGTDTLTAVGGQGNMVAWRLSTGDLVVEEWVGGGTSLASAFSRDLRRFAAVTLGNDPYIDDLVSGDYVEIDVGQEGLSIDDMAFDPSGSTLAVVTHAGVVLWDVASSRPKGEILAGIPGAYRSITVENGGAVAAAVGERGVAVWNLNAEPPLMQRIEPSGISRPDEVPNMMRGGLSAAFSPDGNLLAWTAHDNTVLFVVVWDLKNGRERTRLPDEQVISFSPDGDRIATQAFNAEDMVNVTDLGSGRVEQYPAVPWTTPAVAASDQGAQPSEPLWQVDNGQGLGASIPANGTLALWNTTRTQRVAQIEIDVEPDDATLAFDAQGRRLAVTVAGGLAFIIDMNPDSWRTQACDRAARKLTESERATYLGSIAMENGCP